MKAAPGELAGENLIAELSSGQNVLLLGRSGLGKSFHLEHYRRRCAESGEIPILVHAGHYRGDLNRAIHKAIGPYTSLTPAELLDAAGRIGMRVVLIVDDWNKCPAGSQGDLGSDLASFQVRYGARVVVAAQQRPLLPFFTKFRGLELAALRPEQKRQIFAFHVGPPDANRECSLSEAFSTAFDLSVAARSCKSGSLPATRWELYDSYTRSRLPNPAARATARQLAWFMGENIKPFLSTAEYERISERFASELGAPVTVVEEVTKSGLVVIEGDTVAFEHDLLRDFFRSESLLRDASGQTLIDKLLEPKYADLAEFVVPNIAEETTLLGLLAHADSRLLSLGFRGGLGPRAQSVIRQQCHDLLLRTRDRLPQVRVEPVVGEFEDGRKFVSSAHTDERSSASSHERVICAVIVDNLEDYALREAFLELLDVGEWALKAAADEAARAQGLKPLPVWRELMRLNVVCRHSGSIHPLLLMSANLRDTPRFGESSRPSPLRDALLERARAKSSGALVQLILMSELRYSEAIAIEDVVNLFTQAWSSGVYIIQMEALDFVHSCASAICKEGPQAEARIIELLEGVDVSKNVMLSTQWLEARASFTGFDCGITTEDALAEYRRIIATAANGDDPLWELERERDPDATFAQFASSFASSALGKIFEDIFQGVYYEAYELLAAAEKQRLLTLALQDRQSHLFQAWYLRELRKVGCNGAKDILARLGSRIDGDAFCPQETVETFAVANEAWASISEEPLHYADPSSPDHRVWAIAGELIFWLSRPDGQNTPARAATLFVDLRGAPEAVPDVLHHLGSGYMGTRQAAPFTTWLAKHRDGVRAVLDCCLEHEGRLTSAFKGAEYRQRELFSWVISTLAEIGDSKSIQRLRVWTDHPVYGKGAIRAIETIEQRDASAARV
ncbi:MAG: hypothetical protein ABSB35_10980 [Bryobacteraceae bacterium]